MEKRGTVITKDILTSVLLCESEAAAAAAHAITDTKYTPKREQIPKLVAQLNHIQYIYAVYVDTYIESLYKHYRCVQPCILLFFSIRRMFA